MNRTNTYFGIPKEELIEELARRTGLSRSRSAEIVPVLLELLDRSLAVSPGENPDRSQGFFPFRPLLQPEGGEWRFPPS